MELKEKRKEKKSSVIQKGINKIAYRLGK